jgi:anaerobic selenocysteine-containing dehydrogenase
MSKLSSIGGTHISRRSLLQAAAAVGSMPVLAMSADPAWAAKMAKTAVAYQDTPHGDQNCANCKFFEPPSSCKLVDGVISPNAWCKLWAKKAG